MSTIIFYDLTSALPEKVWSPNTWKVRYCLNYKALPYKTEWVEFPDIEAHCKKLGIPPTSVEADGTPAYTLPALHDPATGTYIADSLLIAEYLEKTYPTPSIFPHGTAAFQALFDGALRKAALGPLWPFIIPAVHTRLAPASAAYFRTTREPIFGKALEEVTPTGAEGVAQWAAFEAGLDTVDKWYAKSGGPFIMGDTTSWADFIVGSWLIWLRTIWGEGSQQWKDVASWHGGRWAKVLGDLEEYQKVD
ncbi:hypothetical protein HYPSUDRAFT_142565 [Hypholoma sublateritium FD-334 SS-4]|uniref:GST N-terminal domain-containing protein n=1 Tax=Hypholoma sublateritium (strain FD-334 SS-4) TaxID=945553 RepID=A0A0D2NUR9_HYPSF|nr:hypothetical protein HYPSUDRAFT_142565 [Hypholoma sublateritium FD-334 SS-4]